MQNPRILPFLLFVLAISAACATGPGPSPAPEGTPEAAAPRFTAEQLAAVEARAAEYVAAGAGGVAVGIQSGDEVVMLRAFGPANASETLLPDTVLEVGSVTKQFTAALILMAEEEGKLSLDDRLRTTLAGYPARGEAITIRHLLSHTAGLVSYTNVPGFFDDGAREYTPEELVALFSDLPLEFAPGTGWNYSNSGYYLLGLILETVYLTPYETLLEEKLFSPLGLDDTGYCDRDPSTLDRAQGHTGGVASASVHMSQPGAAGAICSTAADLLAWSVALQRGDVVDADLNTRATLDDGTPTPYGYGLFVGRSNWRPTIAHGGNIPGFTARTARYLADSADDSADDSAADDGAEPPLDLVLLSNRDGADLFALERDLVSILLGAFEHTPPTLPLDASAANSLIGNYTAIGLPPVTISFDDGELRGAFGDSPPLLLNQLAERDFEYAPANLALRFVAGTPRILEIEQAGILLFLTTP